MNRGFFLARLRASPQNFTSGGVRLLARLSAHVAARDPFENILERWESQLQVEDKIEFTSQKLLDLKTLKEKGILKSYMIEGLTETSDVVEEVGCRRKNRLAMVGACRKPSYRFVRVCQA